MRSNLADSRGVFSPGIDRDASDLINPQRRSFETTNPINGSGSKGRTMRERQISQRERQRRDKQRDTPLGTRMGVRLDERPAAVSSDLHDHGSVGALNSALDPRPPPLKRRPAEANSITLLRKTEIASAFGVSPWTIDRWVQGRQVPASHLRQ